MIKKAIRFWIPAIALVLLGIGCLGVPGFRFSAAVCFGAAAVVLCYWLLSLSSSKAARWIRRCLTGLLIIGSLLAAVTFGFIAEAGTGDPEKACDYLIVLGAGVNGRNPSLILRERLEAAESYLKANKIIP